MVTVCLPGTTTPTVLNWRVPELLPTKPTLNPPEHVGQSRTKALPVSVLSSASYDTHVPGVGLGHSDAVGLGVAVAAGVPVAVGVGVCAKVVEEMRTNPKSDAKPHRTPSPLRRSGCEDWKRLVRDRTYAPISFVLRARDCRSPHATSRRFRLGLNTCLPSQSSAFQKVFVKFVTFRLEF